MPWHALTTAAVAYVLRRQRYTRPALLLLCCAAVEVVRGGTALLLSGQPRPYQGELRALWLAGEVLPYLTPAAALLGLSSGRWAPALGSLAFVVGYVAGAGIRGPTLLAAYVAAYLASAAVGFLALVGKGVLSAKLGRSEYMLLWFCLTTVAGQGLIYLAGTPNWWGVWVVNGASALAALVAALVAPEEVQPQS